MLTVSSFRELLEVGAQRFANLPFLAADEFGEPVSYRALLEFARGLEIELEELNIPIGEPVATVFHNSGTAVLFFLSVIASGRVLVPLNPAASQDELTYMLTRAKCAAVFYDPTHARASDMGDRPTIKVIDHPTYYRKQCGRGRDTANVSRDWGAPRERPFVGEIVFTSGSTGRPKGVVLSERSLLTNAAALAEVYGLTASDRFLTVCPLFHNSGQLFTTLSCALVGGSTAAVKSDIGMMYFWHYAALYGADWSLGMVSFLALLLSQEQDNLPSVSMRGLLTGGSAIDAELIRTFESRFGVPVRAIYGLTESSSIATAEPRDPNPRSLGSSGAPLPGCDVRIRSESGELARPNDAEARTPGEIWIGGPTIFNEYVGDKEMTTQRKCGEWLRSGDLGYFDDNGNLFVVDRLDSMLIVGGENVYPAEIERLGMLLPGAAQIVVTGVDHKIWRTELVLVYKVVDGQSVDTALWHRVLAQHVSPYKLPQRYVALQDLCMDQFPRRTNGKLDRQALELAVRKTLSN